MTLAAKTREGQGAAFNVAAATFFPVVPGHGDLMQVNDRIAFGTDEVDMGICIGIKSFDPLYCGYTGDRTLCFELRQIPVNRRQRDVRMFLMQHLVHHLCGWVGIGLLQAGKDRVALFELLVVFSIGTSCSICD